MGVCILYIYIDTVLMHPLIGRRFFQWTIGECNRRATICIYVFFCMTCIYIFILLSRWNSCYETSALCVIAQRRSFVTWTRSKKLLRACVCHVIQVPSFMKFDIIYTVLMYFGILCSCVCVYTRVYLVLDAFPCEGRLLTI